VISSKGVSCGERREQRRISASENSATRMAESNGPAGRGTGMTMPEMLFAHLKRILEARPVKAVRPVRRPREFHLTAIAKNLRKLAKLIP
jgi:hypothetical protein